MPLRLGVASQSPAISCPITFGQSSYCTALAKSSSHLDPLVIMASSPLFEKSHYTTTSRTYPLTTVEWPDEGVVVVSNVAALRLATFSCEFLRKGHITDWHYVVEACSAIVNEKGVLYPRTDDPLRTRLDRTSTASYAPDRLELSEQIRPMHLVYVRTDDPKALTSWQIGPRFKYKMRGPSSGSQSSGTLSHSSRSTALQSEFRNLLGRRDGSCVVTDAFAAEAAHIILRVVPNTMRRFWASILSTIST